MIKMEFFLAFWATGTPSRHLVYPVSLSLRKNNVPKLYGESIGNQNEIKIWSMSKTTF